MDKIRKQKFDYFLLDLDGKIKEIRNYLMLDKGSVLLDAIEKFEEENAEFLQYYSAGQDELNKRKWIIQFILFPILSDDKVEELIQYHLLEALEAGLDLEELMKMRAITISELLWPKTSQQYLKALMQNTQLIGGDPLVVAGENNSFLPYIKNWINIYNSRFGIEKHTGLEPHQFVLENPNARRLPKELKEKLLLILGFYEGLKIYSLSEIEAELRKIQMGFAAQQAAAYSLNKERRHEPTATPQQKNGALKQVKTAAATQKNILQNARIKITNSTYPPAKQQDIAAPLNYSHSPLASKIPEEFNKSVGRIEFKGSFSPEKEIEENHILDLIEKYPVFQDYKLTANSISLPIAPFNLSPTVRNWIQYYYKECGKGKHSPQERSSFLELLKKSQNLSLSDTQKLQKIFRSVDEKTPLPFDKKKNELLLDMIKVGQNLKAEDVREIPSPSERSVPLANIKSSENKVEKNPNRYLGLEFIPTVKNDEEITKKTNGLI